MERKEKATSGITAEAIEAAARELERSGVPPLTDEQVQQAARILASRPATPS